MNDKRHRRLNAARLTLMGLVGVFALTLLTSLIVATVSMSRQNYEVASLGAALAVTSLLLCFFLAVGSELLKVARISARLIDAKREESACV